MKPARRSAGDPSRLNRVAARRSSLRFGRNTLGIPPSRALSAGRLTGLGAHAGSTTGCSPRRFAALCVAFRSKYTRYSSLTRLVSRTPTGRTGPRRSRRSPGFHHRLLAACGRSHAAQLLWKSSHARTPTSGMVPSVREPPPGELGRPPVGTARRRRANGEVPLSPVVQARPRITAQIRKVAPPVPRTERPSRPCRAAVPAPTGRTGRRSLASAPSGLSASPRLIFVGETRFRPPVAGGAERRSVFPAVPRPDQSWTWTTRTS